LSLLNRVVRKKKLLSRFKVVEKARKITSKSQVTNDKVTCTVRVA
jgi:hypothetical protein